MTSGSSQQTAENIASALVARHDTIGDHEGSGTDVICHDTDGYVGIVVHAVFFACHAADLVAEGTDGVHVKDGVHVLDSHCQTLQAHACIDVLLDQIGIVAVAVVVELGEYDVPYFHVSVALAAHGTVRLSAAVLFTAVIIDLGAGAAGA